MVGNDNSNNQARHSFLFYYPYHTYHYNLLQEANHRCSYHVHCQSDAVTVVVWEWWDNEVVELLLALENGKQIRREVGKEVCVRGEMDVH
jgi:hypothetical protein